MTPATSPPTSPRKSDRTYGQYCPIAAGLDVLGDRWTLLVCRELAMGDRRFTDLRTALSGIAPNLLTDRLRALTAAGLVESVELPPPAARTVYRLTDEGRSVRPILRALARFGANYLEPEDAEQSGTGQSGTGQFSADRAANALLAAWRRRSDVDLRVRLVLESDSADLLVSPSDTRVVACDGDADVTITTTVGNLVRARQGGGFVGDVDGSVDDRAATLYAFSLDPVDD